MIINSLGEGVRKELMNIAYINGSFIPKDEIKISPDDRGFLFADGVYEVMKWYNGFFYDEESHLVRLRRSIKEVRINWHEESTVASFAAELIKLNGLSDRQALVYIQITRGASPRAHVFPEPEVIPTVYAFVKECNSAGATPDSGVKVMLKEDPRWTRCDIKSISLIANILSLQEAHEKGMSECVFVRNGLITEAAHSNIFFVIDGTLFTHPESQHILSGITRKNVLRIAGEAGIPVKEEAVFEKDLGNISEAFITNTSAEISSVIAINDIKVGNGLPGPVAKLIRKNFNTEIINH